MKEHMRPLTASITGIDGSGKSTVSKIVTDQLGVGHTIAGISRPSYSVIDGNLNPEYSKLTHAIDVLHGMADRRESKKMSLAANAFNVILQGRFIEPRFIQRIHPDLVLGTRDYLIDPSVYALFYSPHIANKTAEERLGFFQKLTGSEFRNVIFFLTVPPDEAVARIDRRIEKERMGEMTSSREKWRHMHEQEDHLNDLQIEYHNVFSVVRERADSEIVEIDTSYFPQAEVADIISSKLKGLI